MAIMEWFRVNGYNYMYGSLRLDKPMERLVFVELLALASISRVRRTVCLSEGVPYPRTMLAGLIGISEQQLNDAIDHHAKDEMGRLRINQWGGIEIISWDKYQSESYDRVRKFREKKRKCNDDVTESVTTCNGREENRIEENRIEENRIEENRKEKKNIYPSKEEFCKYISENKLNIKNPESLWQGYQDGNWIDTRGKPVKNWKLKLRTLHDFAENKKPVEPLLVTDADGKTPKEKFMEKINADKNAK